MTIKNEKIAIDFDGFCWFFEKSSFFIFCKLLVDNHLLSMVIRPLKNDPKMSLFGSKTGLSDGKKDILFCVFSLFHVFIVCKPLSGRNLRRAQPSQKNRV